LVARLATGEVASLSGDALRWIQPALAQKATPDLAIRRGSIIRLVRTDHEADPARATWAVGQWPKSKNLVSIRIVQNVGVAAARDWAGRFGFDIDRQPDNLTLALGTGSTTPLQLASAYAVFANGGHRVTPVVIARIVEAQGKVLYEAPPPAPLDESNRAIPARNAFVMESLLQQVTRTGTAARAQQALKRPDLYGKTGTTNDAVDAWFAGFQPSVVGVAWMGYDTPESLGTHESGGGVALPIWIDYMQQALKGVPVSTLKPPDGVVERDGDWTYDDAPEAVASGGSTP
jgi:penicillin-binding protein 1A